MTICRILIVEDSASLAMSYAAQLTEAGHHVEVCGTGAEAASFFTGNQSFEVVLLDLQLPDANGLDLLKTYSDDLGETSVIVITADGSLTRAIDAMRLGAYDFLVKPVNSERLLTTVRNAAERGLLNREIKAVRSIRKKDRFQGFVGESTLMQAVYRSIENIADSNATVFITGESGTGKEVAADAIHKSGRRASGPFVALNCGAIPENLLESEIFGHVKGAFTGALENRIGAAKEADGGTLFLDEVCEMELKLQVKLLRFLQTGMIQRVGASRPEPVNVRVVCATNRNPALEVAEGRFREDLYYRLNVIPLELPPLRERGDDVQQIADFFVEKFSSEEGKEFERVSDESRRTISTHAWPGNVRELQNTIRRAIVMGSGPELEITIGAGPTASQASPADDTADIASHQTPGEPATDMFGHMTMMAIEQAVITQRIDKMGGNVTKAARSLDLSPSTLYRKMEKWN